MKNNIQNKIQQKPPRRKYIIAAGIFLPVTIVIFVLGILNWQSISDMRSEKIIREITAEQLNKDPNDLINEDFMKVTQLELEMKELSDIKTLKKFANLQMLGISRICSPEKAIPKWKAFLAKVGILNLEERFELDLSPIDKLNTLETIYIFDTPVKNIKPLASLANLRVLCLEKTGITNLKPVRNLVNLKELNLRWNPISNLDTIKKLENLQKLYIGGCENITDQQKDDLQKALPGLRIER